jgi:type II secretory ATPase GspE/PulE/Tfp pilus assembly ATPase PilB-like protein
VCQHCAETWPISAEQNEKLTALVRNWEGETLHAKGCEECNGIGYSGRVGLYELLILDGEMVSAIADGLHAPGLRALLRKKGYASLVDDALEKARQGITTLDEVLRILPHRQIQAEIDSLADAGTDSSRSDGVSLPE